MSGGVMGWLARLRGEAARAQALPAGAVLVDVRSEGEFASGHIEGALWVSLDRLHLDLARHVPDRSTPLVLYCRSGARSGRGCGIAAALGYTQVCNGGGIGLLALQLQRPIAVRRG